MSQLIIDKQEQTERTAHFYNLVMNDRFKNNLEMALPKHMCHVKMCRIIMSELQRTPKLLLCDPTDVLSAAMFAAEIGLYPGKAFNHAYFVPYENKKMNKTECNLIIGYRGMIQLAYRSEKVSSITANFVFDGDDFDYEFGSANFLRHRPKGNRLDKYPSYAYCYIKLKNGEEIFDVMTLEEIKRIQGKSKTGQTGPWQTDFNEMAKKCPVRRIFKYTPTSVEMATAIAVDEQAEYGEKTHLHSSITIENEGEQIEDVTPQITRADELITKLQEKKKEYAFLEDEDQPKE